MWLGILKMLLDCMLIKSSHVAALVVVDLSKAFGERMSNNRCSHVRQSVHHAALLRDGRADGR